MIHSNPLQDDLIKNSLLTLTLACIVPEYRTNPFTTLELPNLSHGVSELHILPIKLADLVILRLCNCERAGWVFNTTKVILHRVLRNH